MRAWRQWSGQRLLVALVLASCFATRMLVVSAAWAPVHLNESDWLVFIRLQKTGSQTLWSNFVEQIDGSAWGSSYGCGPGVFCCDSSCDATLEFEFRSRGNPAVRHPTFGNPNALNKCHFITRGHSAVRDILQAAKKTGVPENHVHFMTIVREPVARTLSEFRHVTLRERGRGWDYLFRGQTLSQWLDCKECRVGSSNRQTRMLSGTIGTGAIGTPEEERAMLERAKERVRNMAVVGTLDRLRDFVTLVKYTFPGQFGNLNRLTELRHPHEKKHSKGLMTGADEARLREMNALDLELYAYSKELFAAQFKELESRRPVEPVSVVASSRRGNAPGGRLQQNFEMKARARRHQQQGAPSKRQARHNRRPGGRRPRQ